MAAHKTFARALLAGLVASFMSACASVVVPADGSSDAVTFPDVPADTGSPIACVAPTDCTWGEIPHEIHSPADCICLFGCPTLPMNVTTAARRQAQYRMYCVPGVNGHGGMCGVDDCADPGPLACQMGVCVPAR